MVFFFCPQSDLQHVSTLVSPGSLVAALILFFRGLFDSLPMEDNWEPESTFPGQNSLAVSWERGGPWASWWQLVGWPSCHPKTARDCWEATVFLAEETGGAVTCFPGRTAPLVFRKSGFFPYQGGLAGDKGPGAVSWWKSGFCTSSVGRTRFQGKMTLCVWKERFPGWGATC